MPELLRPTLVLVCGAPGSGKTTLAHEIARNVPCPAICRDEIKEGIVHADGVGKPAWGGPVSKRTFEAFFGVVRYLLEHGVSVVAEAAFKKQLWEPDVRPLVALADARILRCVIDRDLARERISRRLGVNERRDLAHPDEELLHALDAGALSFDDFDRLTLDEVPTLDVDTSDGYRPRLEEIIAFVDRDR
jgi:predicted kinase